MDLVALLSRHEGKTLEFKQDLSSPEGALKAIVAFANTSGGVLLLGVEDGTKKVKGIRDILKQEERLANLIADSISPKLVPSMEVIPWRKTQVLAVEVYPSPNRPHYLNRLGPAEARAASDGRPRSPGQRLHELTGNRFRLRGSYLSRSRDRLQGRARFRPRADDPPAAPS